MARESKDRQHEHSVNVALAEVLDEYGYDWDARSEFIGAFTGAQRPDIIVTSRSAPPIILEAEVKVDSQSSKRAESEAVSRLGLEMSGKLGGNRVNTSVALLYPPLSVSMSPQDIRDSLRSATLEYALYSTDEDNPIVRFPEAGWITGTIFDLAALLHVARVPAWQIDDLAESFQSAVVTASGLLSNSEGAEEIGNRISELMNQENDSDQHSLRMAMVVLMNALIFHDALSAANLNLPRVSRKVKCPDDFYRNGVFSRSQLREEWDDILSVNFWPIFSMSKEIVSALPTKLASDILAVLWRTAEFLVSHGATKSHDITGMVFQRLIADRQFLAAYYTRPASASLLSGLAIPNEYCDWSNAESVSNLRIGDFACGTGTLLSTAYRRVLLLHELHGGDPSSIHSKMMMDGLVGLDVLPVAVHLTASMLAGIHPSHTYDRECIVKMPFGLYKYGPCVGSLELLAANDKQFREALKEIAVISGGKGEVGTYDFNSRVGDNFDIVIMNPPFTRSNDDIKGSISTVSAMNFDKTEQVILNNRLKSLVAGGCGHGNAGLASHFTEIGHQRTRVGGRLALVLPMTVLTGDSWRGVRQLLKQYYDNLVVVTIAKATALDCSFSADTGMAECLVVGEKVERKFKQGRVSCVVLNSRPDDTVIGNTLSAAILQAISAGESRSLETGPYGGTEIWVGDTKYGEVLECPIPENDDAWPVAGVKDMTLAQTAHQLQNGELWIAGMSDGISVPIGRMDSIAKLGFYHLAIIGTTTDRNGVPQGPFDLHDGCTSGSEYPALWTHDASRERSLTIEPWQHLKVRKVSNFPDLQKMVDRIMEKNSRIHYNATLRYNSQSTIVQFTERPAIGGSGWPNIILESEDDEYLFSLWCNSTLGLVCHWWMSSKTQPGRGITSHDTMKTFPTINLTILDKAKKSAAKQVFQSLQQKRFLPYNQIHEDESRKTLDELLLVEVLGLPGSLCEKYGPMDLLRSKLALEPKLHGGKKTKLVFAERGEESKKLTREELSKLNG